MAAIREQFTKDGRRYFEIRVRCSREKPETTTRWYPSEGRSEKFIQRELQKAAAEFERQVKAGEVLGRSERKAREEMEAAEAAKIVTLRQYSKNVFMPDLTVTASENTRSNFQIQLDNHILPALGDFKLPEITTAQITALLLSMQSKGLKISTVIKTYTIMNMIFKKAYFEETIEKNPMDRVKRPRPTKAEGRETQVEAFTGEELKRILDCLEREPLKWRAFIRLLIDTGCRRGEALGLTWENVNFRENSIQIAQSLNYTAQKGVYAEPPKSGKSRTIYVDPAVMQLLKELKASYKVMKFTKDSFVFLQDDSSEPMHPTSPTHYFRQFGKRYGIENFHPHKLRHSFASVAITNGADIASVSEKLGHADKSTTLRMYTHADAESQKRASEIFRKAISQ